MYLLGNYIMAKTKSKVPDLSKEDTNQDPKENKKIVEKGSETKSKPRYVTVEKTEEPKIEETLQESAIPEKKESAKLEIKGDKEKSTLEPPKTDVKVTPSFSLLDADKKASDKKEETTDPEVKLPESTPKITLENSENLSTDSLDDKKVDTNDEKSDQSSKEVKKWLNETPITQDSGVEESNGVGKKIILIVVIIMLIAGALGGGFYYYKTNMQTIDEAESSDSDQIVVREADDPTSTPMPSEEEEEEVAVVLSEYSVSVLNGSGIPGEAGNVAEVLIEAGFDEPDTGNAESYDYASTQISLKADIPESVFDTISNALSSSYDVSSVPAELDDDSTYDIIVIVGANEPEAEPTATPTPEDLEE